MNIILKSPTTFLITTNTGNILISPSEDALDKRDESNTIVALHKACSLMRFQETNIISGPGEYEIDQMRMVGIATRSASGEDINTMYSVQAEGLNICAIGAIAAQPDTAAIQAADKVDILIVDVLSTRIPSGELADVLRNFEAIITIVNGYDSDTEQVGQELEDLLEEMDIKEPEILSKLSLSQRKTSEKEVRTIALIQSELN